MKASLIRAVIFGILIFDFFAKPGFAQSGIIAFRDECTRRLYAMRGDGSGRVELPLPWPVLPDDLILNLIVLDVTTQGPATVVYHISLLRPGFSDSGVFAVQVDEAGGFLVPHAPIPLTLPPIAGVDPNNATRGSFVSAGSGDRMALVAGGPGRQVLMTARIERDSNSKIIGMSDVVAVGDLLTLATPNPNFPDEPGFAGFVDYSPEGRKIVASVYYDLWMIHLREDNTLLSLERLTENTERFAEWNPSFSPDGRYIAYATGAISQRSGGVQEIDIHTVELSTRITTPVTTKSNKGAAETYRNNPMWSPDGRWIGFTASTGRAPRGSMCADLTNSEIFLARPDGSTTAVPLTNTNGTSVEALPRWGW